MKTDRDVAELEAFLATRGKVLLGASVLLTGSTGAGEDLLQAALERLLRRWRRFDGDPEGYLRQTLYHLAADGRRRQRRSRDRLSLLSSIGTQAAPDGTEQAGDRDQLVRLLRQLPPGQRAAIVLRYWEDMTEAEAARVLGCSVGTIKSATSRGLRRLRELSDSTPAMTRSTR